MEKEKESWTSPLELILKHLASNVEKYSINLDLMQNTVQIVVNQKLSAKNNDFLLNLVEQQPKKLMSDEPETAGIQVKFDLFGFPINPDMIKCIQCEELFHSKHINHLCCTKICEIMYKNNEYWRKKNDKLHLINV
jgi:hypothetical protein